MHGVDRVLLLSRVDCDERGAGACAERRLGESCLLVALVRCAAVSAHF